MIQTEADQHFYQDVHWSSSTHLIDERQEAESIINTLSSKVLEISIERVIWV